MGFLDRLLGRREVLENPTLVKAMRTLATHDNPTERKIFYQTLADARLMIPTLAHIHDEELQLRIRNGEGVPFLAGKNILDQPVLLAFTDDASLGAWRPGGCNSVVMSGSSLFPFLLRNNFAALVLNPAGPTGGEISTTEIRILAEGGIPQPIGTGAYPMVEVQIPPGGKLGVVQLQEPPPEEWVSRLRAGLGFHPEISDAYLALLTLGEGNPHYAVGILFSPIPPQKRVHEIMTDLTVKLSPLVEKSGCVDLFVLQGDSMSLSVQTAGLHFFTANKINNITR